MNNIQLLQVFVRGLYTNLIKLYEGNVPIKTELHLWYHLESDKHVVVTHTATAYRLKYMSQVEYIDFSESTRCHYWSDAPTQYTPLALQISIIVYIRCYYLQLNMKMSQS